MSRARNPGTRDHVANPVTPWTPSRRAVAKVANPLPVPEVCRLCGAEVDADRAMLAARDAEDAAHIKNLCELVRMPNAEYVADAHNAAVKYLRLRARAQQEHKP